MPTCNHCGTEHEAPELVRHEREGLLLVHCPDCNCLRKLSRSGRSPVPIDPSGLTRS